MELELISFKLCPFVQRSVITLLHKKADFRITYIELSDPPSWFLDISPFKKVPVLRVGDNVIFESAVINEYVDDVTPGSSLPKDPLLRALNKSWIEFGSSCLWDCFHLSTAEDIDSFISIQNELRSKFDQLERVAGKDPFFNGKEFSLVDAAYAPLFMRLELLKGIYPDLYNDNRHPRVYSWADTLLSLNEVQRSVVPNIKQL